MYDINKQHNIVSKTIKILSVGKVIFSLRKSEIDRIYFSN